MANVEEGEVVVVGAVSAAVRAAVIEVVKSLEAAFNAHDPIALSELYAEEASWSTVMGQRLDGRRAIAEFAGPAMKGALSGSYARYDVVKLLAIRPDVIAVNIIQTPTDGSGTPVQGPRGAALFVIAKDGNGWKIVAGQNTFVGGPPA